MNNLDGKERKKKITLKLKHEKRDEKLKSF